MLVEVKRINKAEVTVVSSLDVAETFGKNHRDVMESVRNIESSISTAEFSALFHMDSYKASNGKTNPMYLMNRDGFTLLVMGYTGDTPVFAPIFYLPFINQIKPDHTLIYATVVRTYVHRLWYFQPQVIHMPSGYRQICYS